MKINFIFILLFFFIAIYSCEERCDRHFNYYLSNGYVTVDIGIGGGKTNTVRFNIKNVSYVEHIFNGRFSECFVAVYFKKGVPVEIGPLSCRKAKLFQMAVMNWCNY